MAERFIENCTTCSNRASRVYVTIRCAIWMPKIQKQLVKLSDSDDIKSSIGRMHNKTRCQHYQPFTLK